MNGTTWQRALALTGALWIILIVLGNDILGGGGPEIGDPLSVYAAHYADVSTANWAAGVVTFAGLGLGLVFVSVVAERISAAGMWSRLALASGTASLTVKLLSDASTMAAMYRGSELSPELLRTLTDIGAMAFVISFLPLGLFTLATSAGARQLDAAPTWVIWLGVVAGTLLIIGAPFALNGPGFIGMLVFLVWAIAFSATLALRPARLAPSRGKPERTALTA